MIPCPSCGGELTFDIASQMLKCPFCEGVFSPTETGTGKAAETQTWQENSAPQADPYLAQDVTAGYYGQQPQQAQPQQMQYQQGYAQPQQQQMQYQEGYAQAPAAVAGAFAQPGQMAAPQEQIQAPQQADFFEVVSYTCPQCGGTIYSTEQSVNGFCSYCGSSVMLQARMASMPQPKKLIPFRIDKNACKNSYANFVGKNFYAPKEFKDPNYLELFRGIYMPYWVYDMNYNGDLRLKGTKSYRRGNYVYTEHYDCRCYVDSYYRGLSYDASSGFDDYYSEGIAPFDAHTMVDFHPNYMSGYYADMADVSSDVYVGDAMSFVGSQLFTNVKNARCFPGVTIASDQAKSVHPIMEGSGPYTAFFPVWFLSFRRKDRVAYAVVNGQTGKVVGDLPVDTSKFLLVTVVLSLLSYLGLAFFPAMRPDELLIICGIFSLVNVILLISLMRRVVRRESHEDDKGFLSRNDKDAYRKKQLKDRSEGTTAKTVLGIIFAVFMVILSLGGGAISALVSLFSTKLPLFVAGVAIAAMILWGMSYAGKLSEGAASIRMGLALILGSVVYILLVQTLRPPGDGWYYGGAFALLGATVISQLSSLKQYNMLTTRPLPQLNRKGGNDSAPV